MYFEYGDLRGLLYDPTNAPNHPPRITGIFKSKDCHSGVSSRDLRVITVAIIIRTVSAPRENIVDLNVPHFDILAVIRPPIIAETVIEMVETNGTSGVGSSFFDRTSAPNRDSKELHIITAIKLIAVEKSIPAFCVGCSFL